MVQLAFLVLLAVDFLTTTTVSDGTGSTTPLVVAAVLVIAVQLATVLLPSEHRRWNRLPHACVAILPVLDLVAIGLTRIGLPQTGADTLCVIPALWLALEFGFQGAIVAGVAVAATMSVPWMLVLGPVEGNLSSAILDPALAVVMASLLAWVTRHLARSDEEVERQRRVNAAIMDTVDVGLLLLDSDGNYVTMNKRHADFMRLAFPDGHDGHAGHLGLVYSEDGSRLLRSVEMPTYRASRGEEFDDERIWVGDDPLTWRALSVSARPVHDDEGRMVGAALAYTDVTDFMRALRVKDEFVASVSHELRTPLTSIRGYTDLVQEVQDLSPEVARNMAVISRNADRLARMVADLLHSAQMSSGSVQLVRTRSDLAGLVRDCVTAAFPNAEAAGIALSADLPDRLEAMIDPHRIGQAVDNLIANAIKYTPAGGEVLVQVEVDHDRAEVSVQDTGMGIDAADVSRLFTRFFRTSNAKEQSIQGVGLGLSITKSIVESHGGRIEVQSRLGHGSVFRIRLPLEVE